MWRNLLMLALGGALGTLARYGVSGAAQRLIGPDFPWGTLAVNVAGCFLVGVVSALGEDRIVIPLHWRLLILTGFLGGFTTFSTFGLETQRLLADAQSGMAAVNLLANNGLGLIAVVAGAVLGRAL